MFSNETHSDIRFNLCIPNTTTLSDQNHTKNGKLYDEISVGLVIDKEQIAIYMLRCGFCSIKVFDGKLS